jgi:hypothetical protein
MKINNFMKIHPVVGELFHTDGQMDGQKDRPDEVLTVAFSIF